MTSEIKLELKNIGKKYNESDDFSVKDINLQVEKGEFIALVGPSGCGKSTTLRMIAGLEVITEGELLIDDKVVNDVEPKDRAIAMVFQNYALYPHMTIYNNMAYGLKVKKIAKEEIDKKVKWAAEILELTDHLDKKPGGLSGGQRQRVALGRCMVRDVNLFLMDEPLSNLDAKLRVTMRNEIKALHDSLGTTTIYVTHDQVEAMTMADRIVLLEKGVIRQVGAPMDLYNDPNNLFVAQFIGSPQMNVIEVEYKNNSLKIGDEICIELGEDHIVPTALNEGRYVMGFRPEDIYVEAIAFESHPKWQFSCKIDFVEKLGNENYIFSKINDVNVRFRVASNRLVNPVKNDNFEFVLNLNKALFFEIESGLRIR